MLTILLLVTTAGYAQTVDVRTFFGSALPAADNFRPQPATPLRNPLVEAFDLRTETDQFDLSRQEYTARFQFSTPGLVRARRDLYRTLLAAPDTEGAEARCDLVESLYEAWISLYLTDRREALTDSLTRVLSDRERLYSLDLGAMRFPYKDLVDLRTTRTTLILNGAELRDHDQLLRKTYGLYGDSLTFAGFPTPADIASLLDAPREAIAGDLERAHELALIEREIELERAEGRGLLDFLQFRYRGNPNDEIGQRFHVGLAFRLQNSGDRHLKVRSLEMERQWLEREGRLEDQLRDTQRAAARLELEWALQRHAFVQTVLSNEAVDLKQIARAAQGTTGANPELLLDIERRRLQNRLKLLDAEAEVLSAYLQWLEDAERLCTGEPGSWLAVGLR